MIAITTENAPSAIGPYSQAISSGQFLFVSGQLPINPETGSFISNDVVDQLHQCMKNIEAIAKAAGTTISNTVKTTILMQDLSDFDAVNKAYAQHVTEPYPARATFQVAALPKGALIEIEAIIALDQE